MGQVMDEWRGALAPHLLFEFKVFTGVYCAKEWCEYHSIPEKLM
jgi:hypothetical protein